MSIRFYPQTGLTQEAKYIRKLSKYIEEAGSKRHEARNLASVIILLASKKQCLNEF